MLERNDHGEYKSRTQIDEDRTERAIEQLQLYLSLHGKEIRARAVNGSIHRLKQNQK